MLLGRLQSSDDIPYEIRKAFIQAPDYDIPEQNLWIEVVARAALDAIGETGESEVDKHEDAMLDAWRWWRTRLEDVHECLDLSGIDRKLQGIMAEKIREMRPSLVAEVVRRIRKETSKKVMPPVEKPRPKKNLTASGKKTTRESNKKLKLVKKKKHKGAKTR